MSREKGRSDYLRGKEPEKVEKLLSEYLVLVKSMACRIASGSPRPLELQKIVNTGYEGLLEAFSNFDPAKGVKFETYAVPRIRGAILDELRTLDWVAGTTRTTSQEIERALTKLQLKLGRIPTDREIAEFMNIPVEEIYSSKNDLWPSNMLCLDNLVYQEEDKPKIPRTKNIQNIEGSFREGILDELEKKELKSFLVSALKDLSEEETLVIASYYYEGLTLRQISEIMSTSESRVSKIHTKALMKLRSMIREKFALSDKELTKFLKNDLEDADEKKLPSAKTFEASVHTFFNHEDYKTLLKSLAMVNKLLDKSLESINIINKQRTKTLAEVSTILENKN